MRYENLLISREPGFLEITINRPDKLNALNQQTLIELRHAFDEAAQEPDIRAIVLTGSGDKAFVAGADISEIQGLKPIDAREFSLLGQRLMSRIQNLGKPVIAAINGYALGGGLELALACSVRLASDNALLGLPEVTLGIMPGFGGTQRLVRLIGTGRALEMTLSGKPVDASTAASLGIVNTLYTMDELLPSARKLAARYARSAPYALAGILDAINKGQDLPLQAGLELETDRFALCCSTNDMQEGTSAFLEKRKPEFTGS